jgi:hypothetical protein
VPLSARRGVCSAALHKRGAETAKDAGADILGLAWLGMSAGILYAIHSVCVAWLAWPYPGQALAAMPGLHGRAAQPHPGTHHGQGCQPAERVELFNYTAATFIKQRVAAEALVAAAAAWPVQLP